MIYSKINILRNFQIVIIEFVEMYYYSKNVLFITLIFARNLISVKFKFNNERSVNLALVIN